MYLESGLIWKFSILEKWDHIFRHVIRDLDTRNFCSISFCHYIRSEQLYQAECINILTNLAANFSPFPDVY
jgi:hypothetical protein